jgi:hypothetical protein
MAKSLQSKESFGLSLYATGFPNAVRILTTWQAQSEMCSGVLISPRHVLTAGHCVCGLQEPWKAATASACKPFLGALKATVLIPEAGLVATVGTPRLHPDYHAPGTVTPARGKLADLAILELAHPVAVPPAVVKAIDSAARHATSSFGPFSFYAPPSGTSYEPGMAYTPGVQQMSIQANLTADPTDCGPEAVADVVCSVDNGLPATQGPNRTAGACGGDSGSPLYELGRESQFKVVGITSYISSGNETCSATPGASGYTYYVNLSRYAKWIQDIAGADLAASSATAPVCGEAVLSPGADYRIDAHQTRAAITPFEAVSGENTPSSMRLSFSSGQCQRSKGFGVAICKIGQEPGPVVRLTKGFAQVIVCQTAKEQP